jgi:hypothetical protein
MCSERNCTCDHVRYTNHPVNTRGNAVFLLLFATAKWSLAIPEIAGTWMHVFDCILRVAKHWNTSESEKDDVKKSLETTAPAPLRLSPHGEASLSSSAGPSAVVPSTTAQLPSSHPIAPNRTHSYSSAARILRAIMKTLLVTAVVFVTTLLCNTLADTTESFRPHVAINGPVDEDVAKTFFNASAAPALGADTPPPPELSPEDSKWKDAYCRGNNLLNAMKLDEAQCQAGMGWRYCQSPWDGTMEQELATWGFDETNEPSIRSTEHTLQDLSGTKGRRTFQALGISPRPSRSGGRNFCHYIEHLNGPTVHKVNGRVPRRAVDQIYTVQSTDYKVCSHSKVTY